MVIKSTQFIKGIVKADPILENGIPQIAFIGRSNVGKSSVINLLTQKKDLAKTSSFPGRTQEINVFLIDDTYYLLDLPGYGFAKTSKTIREMIQKRIRWYLLESGYQPKLIVLIIDANVGPTEKDLEMLQKLETKHNDILIVANKMDKIKRSESAKKLKKVKAFAGKHRIVQFSAEKKLGAKELYTEIFS